MPTTSDQPEPPAESAPGAANEAGRPAVRLLASQDERVETGPVQFGSDDWPGVFIRGDDALNYRLALGRAFEHLPPRDLRLAPLEGLYRLLLDCQVKR